jgi:hypothetical protein
LRIARQPLTIQPSASYLLPLPSTSIIVEPFPDTQGLLGFPESDLYDLFQVRLVAVDAVREIQADAAKHVAPSRADMIEMLVADHEQARATGRPRTS